MWYRRLWSRWKVVADKIGHFQTRLILTLVYFLVVSPFALILRFLRDPLRLWRVEGSNWVSKDAVPHDLDAGRRQY